MLERIITCPGCHANLTVSAAAEQRGRMRCKNCGNIVHVPPGESMGERLRRLVAERAEQSRAEEDGYDDVGKGRRYRRSRYHEEKSDMWIGWVLSLVAVLLLVGMCVCFGVIGVITRR